MKLSEIIETTLDKGSPVNFFQESKLSWYNEVPQLQPSLNGSGIIINLTIEKGKIRILRTDIENPNVIEIAASHINGSISALTKGLVKFKVISAEKSIELFSYKPTKEKMIGTYVTVTSIKQHLCIKDGIERRIAEVNCPELGKNIKFVAEDIEVILPNLNAYLPKKDRTIKKGAILKCIDNRRSFLVRGNTYEYIQGHSKLVNKSSISKYAKGFGKNDCIIVKETQTGKIYISKVKRFKVI